LYYFLPCNKIVVGKAFAFVGKERKKTSQSSNLFKCVQTSLALDISCLELEDPTPKIVGAVP
jgi:hypothetical protein